jgi:RNA polymerase sigma-70 factor (ECF subfamily)
MASEDDTVRRAIAGSREAFAELYDLYARPVLLFLAARLPAREDAEDALQTTFLSAWAALPGLRKPNRFAPWLFRVARSRARDLARRPALRPRPLHDAQDLIGPRREEPAEADRLRALVAKLRPDTRAVVLLRAVEGWSAEEVGRAMGLSASTVRRRYARTLEHLRESLEPGARRVAAERIES